MKFIGLPFILYIFVVTAFWFCGANSQVKEAPDTRKPLPRQSGVLDPDNTDTGGRSLGHSVVLDPDNKYHLFWEFNLTHLTFQIEAETLGYVGLGISPNGGMPGSDIVIGWVDDSTGTAVLQDRVAEGYFEPRLIEPQVSQLDWAYQNDTHTVLRFSRLIDLCNIQSTLQTGTVRLIWAYRDEDPVFGTSLQYHGFNRGTKSVFLLDTHTSKPKIPENSFTFELRNRQATIPARDTFYWCESFSLPEVDSKHHIIKIEPVVENLAEVHHIVLYTCNHAVRNESINVGSECLTLNMPQDWWACYAVIYGWGVGGDTMYFPDHVGLPIGYDGGPTLFMMETHFDNPRRKTGLVDSSGFRITLTPDLRQYDAGSFFVGATSTGSLVIPPHADSFLVNGHCVTDCLTQGMGNQVDKINVFATFMHTHLAGRKVRLRHFRYGVEKEVVSDDPNYDFNFQQTRFQPKERIIKKGDSLVAECSYNTMDRTNLTFSGLGTNYEMCIVSVLHYPKIGLSLCLTEPLIPHTMKFMGVTVNRQNMIESPEEYRGRSWSDVLQSEMDWTNSTTRSEFSDWINKRGVPSSNFIQCTDANLRNTQSLTAISIPQILYELPEDSPPQLCPFVNGGRLVAVIPVSVIAFIGIFALIFSKQYLY